MARIFSGAALSRRFPLGVRAALIVLALGCAAACASSNTARKPPTGTPDPDKFLFEHGTENLNNRRWSVAREYFRQLVDSYPQSEYRADAKLGIGDTYLGEHSAESMVLAANEYREFLGFYPTHKRAYYAQYKLGMTHFYQIKAAMRDQTETRDAIRELQIFVDKYPDSPLTADGKKALREAKDRLDDWDYGVGVQYYHLKWYPGAIGRLEPLIKADPDYTTRDGAYFYLAESYDKLNREAEALPYYERLVKEFEQSDYLKPAQERIAQIKADMAAKAKGTP